MKEKVSINGHRYRATVLQVMSYDDHGRPRNLVLRDNDETVKIEGGEAFMIVYVLEDCLKATKD